MSSDGRAAGVGLTKANRELARRRDGAGMTIEGDDRISVGVIGAGYFAGFHHEAWSRMDDVEVLSVCDRSLDAARDMASRYDISRTQTDSAAFFADGPFDIIDIATPPHTHLEMIRKAVTCARIVVCQKPFCASESEAREAAALARESNIPVVVHENFRFQPWYPQIRNLIETGRLGDLYQATFRLRPGDGQGADAYLARQPYFQELERFLIHETGIHWVDVFRFLFGEPEAVFADLRRLNPVIAGEDSGLFLMRYANGFRAIFDGNRLADHAAEDRRLTMGEFVIEGSRASLRLDGDGQILIRNHGENTEKAVAYTFEREGFGGNCVFKLQRHIVEHLTQGAPLANPADDYLKNMAIEAAIYRSNEHNKWIAVSR